MVDPERNIAKVTSDSLATYLSEVRRKPVLSPPEETALGQLIQQGDAQAVQELVERNLRFVVQVAGKYKNSGIPLPDLINEGNLGLIQAARKFDPDRGARFITYAVWWIRQAILHALAEGGGAPFACRLSKPKRCQNCVKRSKSFGSRPGLNPRSRNSLRHST